MASLEAKLIEAADAAVAKARIGAYSEMKHQLKDAQAVLVAWGTVSDQKKRVEYEVKLRKDNVKYALVTTAEEYAIARRFKERYPDKDFTSCIPHGMDNFHKEEGDWKYVDKEFGEADEDEEQDSAAT